MRLEDLPEDHLVPVEQIPWMRWFYVYRLYDADKNLLYVGMTGDVYTRFIQHRRKQPWGDEIAYVSARRFAYEDLASEYERKLIKELEPPKNVRHTAEDRKAQGRKLHRRSPEHDSQAMPGAEP